jgi:hypothetical protein
VQTFSYDTYGDHITAITAGNEVDTALNLVTGLPASVQRKGVLIATPKATGDMDDHLVLLRVVR